MSTRTRRAAARKLTFVFAFCLAALVLLVFPTRLRAEDMPADQAAWVCVTTSTLASAFAPLAELRESQGLSTRIVTTSDLYAWFPLLPGQTARLRAAVEFMHAEWGTRYLLIGAEQADLPAPYCRLESGIWLWTAPVDLYFGCLENDWDADGDGWVGESVDLPDLTPELAVGRIPAATALEAAVAIAKIQAYEGRAQAERDRVLLASTALMETWTPGPLPLPGNDLVAALLDTLSLAERDFETTAMLQVWQEPPGGEELTRDSLLQAMMSGGYDRVMFFGQADADAWSCGNYEFLTPADLTGLSAGRPFLLDSLAPETCYLLSEGMGHALLFAPGGGAAAVRGSATPGFIFPTQQIDVAFWSTMVRTDHDRVGDLHIASIRAVAESEPTALVASALVSLMLLGDPALLLNLPDDTHAPPAPVAAVSDLRGAPNPFNPGTSVSFELAAAAVARVEIFDVRGRRVAVLHDGPLAAGPHALTWRPDATLSDGVFFARVRTNAGEQAVKLLRLD